MENDGGCRTTFSHSTKGVENGEQCIAKQILTQILVFWSSTDRNQCIRGVHVFGLTLSFPTSRHMLNLEVISQSCVHSMHVRIAYDVTALSTSFSRSVYQLLGERSFFVLHEGQTSFCDTLMAPTLHRFKGVI